jgi:hypothetical protein
VQNGTSRILCTVVNQFAGKFREFAVVAGEHGNTPAVGVDDAGMVATADVPDVALARCGVDFFLFDNAAVTQENVCHVAHAALRAAQRMRTGDDIDAVFLCQPAEVFAKTRREVGERGDCGIRRQHRRVRGKNLQRKKFREDEKICAVIGSDPHKV